MIITIPYKPRDLFKQLHRRTQRWAVVVAHRRAGKTVACINELIRACMQSPRPDGRYAYIAPFYKQAKHVAWDYAKRYSRPIIGVKINEAELRIDYPNGSRLSLYGADNPDALRGLYFDGIIADEYGDWRPSVWPYVIRPALADRQGWAVVIGTPKGKNQFYDVYKFATEHSETWLSLLITATESGILPESEMDALREELSEDAWRQEMECDFDAALPGAIWGKELWKAEQEGRVRPELYNPDLKVHAALDIGFNDDTAIVWFQIDKELRIIDAYSNNHMGVQHYHDVLKSKPYTYAHWLWLPHDAKAKTLASPRSVEQQFSELGWFPRITPNLSLVDGIQAARLTLVNCLLDKKLEEFLNALKQYQHEYDEDKKCFKDKPRHDWTSHYADAFRYACIVWRQELRPKEPEKAKFPQDMSFNGIIERQKRIAADERE